MLGESQEAPRGNDGGEAASHVALSRHRVEFERDSYKQAINHLEWGPLLCWSLRQRLRGSITGIRATGNVRVVLRYNDSLSGKGLG
jgi:hypothetical protein